MQQNKLSCRLNKSASQFNKFHIEFNKSSRHFLVGVIVFVFCFLSACTGDKPQAIVYGHDSCSHCKMTITDRRFGGELVTKKGKVYKFDSLECLNQYMNLHSDDYKIYVADSTQGGNLIEAEKANFEIHSELRSPMGIGILASPRDEKEIKGNLIQWKDLQPKLKK
jgi:copper chaperone NosL